MLARPLEESRRGAVSEDFEMSGVEACDALAGSEFARVGGFSSSACLVLCRTERQGIAREPDRVRA